MEYKETKTLKCTFRGGQIAERTSDSYDGLVSIVRFRSKPLENVGSVCVKASIILIDTENKGKERITAGVWLNRPEEYIVIRAGDYFNLAILYYDPHYKVESLYRCHFENQKPVLRRTEGKTFDIKVELIGKTANGVLVVRKPFRFRFKCKPEPKLELIKNRRKS